MGIYLYTVIMFNLFILHEIFTNNLSYNFIYILSLISIICGIFVIIINNPIVSVLFLIGLFISIAGYLMMLGINFIGLSYLLVYVGAVSILFLFILMLINVRISELVTNNNNSIPLAIMIALFLGIFQFFIKIFNTEDILDKSIDNENILNYLRWDIDSLYFVTSHSWDGRLAEISHITSIGNIIYTNYPIWLILTSIILLLAMVGAIIITIKQ